MFMPSVLPVNLVTKYCGDPMENSNEAGVPVGKRLKSSMPVMDTVALLQSMRGVALADSGRAFPLTSQAEIEMDDPDGESKPETSVTFIVSRELTEFTA